MAAIGVGGCSIEKSFMRQVQPGSSLCLCYHLVDVSYLYLPSIVPSSALRTDINQASNDVKSCARELGLAIFLKMTELFLAKDLPRVCGLLKRCLFWVSSNICFA